MNILNTISATSQAADIVFRIATHCWDKKSLIRMGIVSAAFLGTVLLISKFDDKDEEEEKNVEKEEVIDQDN